MTIKKLIEQLNDYMERYENPDMPVVGIDGYNVSVIARGAVERWTSGGDPYKFYVLDPYGDKQVLVIQ